MSWNPVRASSSKLALNTKVNIEPMRRYTVNQGRTRSTTERWVSTFTRWDQVSTSVTYRPTRGSRTFK